MNKKSILDDTAEIQKSCEFLLRQNFSYRQVFDSFIEYYKDNIIIRLSYERYSDDSNLIILFKENNKAEKWYAPWYSAKKDQDIEFDKYFDSKNNKKISNILSSLKLIKDYPEKMFDENYHIKMENS